MHYVLKKYSHFCDLQETDKYEIYSTKASMYASLTGHAPPPKKFQKSLCHRGWSEIFILVGGGYIVGGGKGGHVILE